MYSKQINNRNSDHYHKENQRDILLQELIIIQMDCLQQRILKASKKIKSPYQALSQAYQMVCEEQKMAFLLAGGAEQLLRYQQQRWQQERREKTDQSSSDPGTDDLPVLCWECTCESDCCCWEGQKGCRQLFYIPFIASSRERHSRAAQREIGLMCASVTWSADEPLACLRALELKWLLRPYLLRWLVAENS